MNDTALLKLKVIVERAVRPVKAPVSRKKKMREELLAHVTGIFDEEVSRSADEQAALIQAEKRFGDPSALSRKLRESVPVTDRSAFLFERLIEPRVGESLVRRAARHGVTSFVVEAGAFIALSPLFPFFWNSSELGIFISFAMLISIGCGGMMFMGTLLINGLEQVLFSAAGRSLSKASLLLVVSSVVPVLLYLAFVFVSDDHKLIDLASTGRILSAAVLFTCILVWLANHSAIERGHREEWAQLQID